MSQIMRNTIQSNLAAFAKQWQNATRENADAKLFWARFYECFGIRPESATLYEHEARKIGGGVGFIDSFMPGKLIVEHKSRGKSLDAAFDQAADYALALPEAERPRYIITSDFARFRLTDLRCNATHECTLGQLAKRAEWFLFLVDDDAADEPVEESPADRRAAYQVSRLHQALLDARFTGHDLEVFMTRLLFCFFADATGIFGENRQFARLVQRSREDGRDLGPLLAELSQVLDTPRDALKPTLDEAQFIHINWVVMRTEKLTHWQFLHYRPHYLRCMGDNPRHYLRQALTAYYITAPRGWQRQFRRKPAKLANRVYYRVCCELDKQLAVAAAAQAVRTARAAHPGATRADLYDPDSMPGDLQDAHKALDKAVDTACDYPGGKDAAAARVAFLFALYQQLGDERDRLAALVAKLSAPPAPATKK